MDEIGKLIFNCLAARRPVWLPNIGTFMVDYVPARDNGNGSITPPRNSVVFSEGREHDAVSIESLMPQEPGGETPAVRYDKWLVKVTERGPAVIEGIGVVCEGVFTPYDSLINTLNPIPAAENVKTKPSGKKGLSRAEKIWIVLIALFILILVVGWSWWNGNNPSGNTRDNTHNAALTDNMDELGENTGALTGEQGVVESVVEERDEDRGPEIETSLTPTARPAGTNPDPGFYVVGNVFSVPENADKYIRDMQKKYPDLNYVKHPYQGNKILVSLYHSTDRREANRERVKIEDRIFRYDLWLYEVR